MGSVKIIGVVIFFVNCVSLSFVCFVFVFVKIIGFLVYLIVKSVLVIFFGLLWEMDFDILVIGVFLLILIGEDGILSGIINIVIFFLL